LTPGALPHLRGATGHHLGAAFSRRLHQDVSRLADPGRNTPGLTSFRKPGQGIFHPTEPSLIQGLGVPGPCGSLLPGPQHTRLGTRRCLDAVALTPFPQCGRTTAGKRANRGDCSGLHAWTRWLCVERARDFSPPRSVLSAFRRRLRLNLRLGRCPPSPGAADVIPGSVIRVFPGWNPELLLADPIRFQRVNIPRAAPSARGRGLHGSILMVLAGLRTLAPTIVERRRCTCGILRRTVHTGGPSAPDFCCFAMASLPVLSGTDPAPALRRTRTNPVRG